MVSSKYGDKVTVPTTEIDAPPLLSLSLSLSIFKETEVTNSDTDKFLSLERSKSENRRSLMDTCRRRNRTACPWQGGMNRIILNNNVLDCSEFDHPKRDLFKNIADDYSAQDLVVANCESGATFEYNMPGKRLGRC